MSYELISNMTIGSMMTWGHMIWIFFPLPVFCLLLLAVPIQRVEQYETAIVRRIFFTKVSVGPIYFRLVYVFIAASTLVFGIASATIQRGFGTAHVPCSGTSCPYHGGETMWYRRASRYRAERNFWLSLFTLVLWLLVLNIYELKKRVVRLRGELEAMRSEGGRPTKKKWRSKKEEKEEMDDGHDHQD